MYFWLSTTNLNYALKPWNIKNIQLGTADDLKNALTIALFLCLCFPLGIVKINTFKFFRRFDLWIWRKTTKCRMCKIPFSKAEKNVTTLSSNIKYKHTNNWKVCIAAFKSQLFKSWVEKGNWGNDSFRKYYFGQIDTVIARAGEDTKTSKGKISVDAHFSS